MTSREFWSQYIQLLLDKKSWGVPLAAVHAGIVALGLYVYTERKVLIESQAVLEQARKDVTEVKDSFVNLVKEDVGAFEKRFDALRGAYDAEAKVRGELQDVLKARYSDDLHRIELTRRLAGIEQQILRTHERSLDLYNQTAVFVFGVDDVHHGTLARSTPGLDLLREFGELILEYDRIRQLSAHLESLPRATGEQAEAPSFPTLTTLKIPEEHLFAIIRTQIVAAKDEAQTSYKVVRRTKKVRDLLARYRRDYPTEFHKYADYLEGTFNLLVLDDAKEALTFFEKALAADPTHFESVYQAMYASERMLDSNSLARYMGQLDRLYAELPEQRRTVQYFVFLTAQMEHAIATEDFDRHWDLQGRFELEWQLFAPHLQEKYIQLKSMADVIGALADFYRTKYFVQTTTSTARQSQLELLNAALSQREADQEYFAPLVSALKIMVELSQRTLDEGDDNALLLNTVRELRSAVGSDEGYPRLLMLKTCNDARELASKYPDAGRSIPACEPK